MQLVVSVYENITEAFWKNKMLQTGLIPFLTWKLQDGFEDEIHRIITYSSFQFIFDEVLSFAD